jgi:Rrf2 family protein
MRVPRAFLQRIVADLSAAELVLTFAGPNGGLQLARPAATINLRQVWEAMEGPLLISHCLQSCEECPLAPGCPVRGRWRSLQTLIVCELEATGLDQLAAEALVIETRKGGEIATEARIPDDLFHPDSDKPEAGEKSFLPVQEERTPMSATADYPNDA